MQAALEAAEKAETVIDVLNELSKVLAEADYPRLADAVETAAHYAAEGGADIPPPDMAKVESYLRKYRD